MVDHPQEYSLETIMSANINEKFKLTCEQYNTISKVHNSQVGHFGLERTSNVSKKTKRCGSFNDSMSGGSKITVLVAKR